MEYTAKCHCGAVEGIFNADIKSAVDCNCSICRAKGALQFRVPQKDFTLIKGKDALSIYKFNTNKASHYFCKYCGIHVFAEPRISTEHFSVNLRCVVNLDLDSLKLIKFDGVNWEDSAKKLGIMK